MKANDRNPRQIDLIQKNGLAPATEKQLWDQTAELGAQTLILELGLSLPLSLLFLWVHASQASWSQVVAPAASDLHRYFCCYGEILDTGSLWTHLGDMPILAPIPGYQQVDWLKRGHVLSPGVGPMSCERAWIQRGSKQGSKADAH